MFFEAEMFLRDILTCFDIIKTANPCRKGTATLSVGIVPSQLADSKVDI